MPLPENAQDEALFARIDYKTGIVRQSLEVSSTTHQRHPKCD
jgi:hypothetical protein